MYKAVIVLLVLLAGFAVFQAVQYAEVAVAERSETYAEYHALKIRVEPALITLTGLDRTVQRIIVVPGSKVTTYESLNPGEPLVVKSWQFRGKWVYQILIPPGYPIYE